MKQYKKTLTILILALLLSVAFSPPLHATVNNQHTIFTTPSDSIKITINFAGNPSDAGGPYWQPPTESIKLKGKFSNGYYTNDSSQQEDWIYINLTITDNESTINQVWLHWLEDKTWTNTSYQFTNTHANFWEINTSEIITTKPGLNYSFDITAMNNQGYQKTVKWEKIVIGNKQSRRYVQLNCPQKDTISYKPFYFYQVEHYNNMDRNKDDRLHHDQGPDGSTHDTGYLLKKIPTDEIQYTWCTDFVGWWFDENGCWQTNTIQNIYYHFWWHTEHDEMDRVGYNKDRAYFKQPSPQGENIQEHYKTNINTSHSMIYSDGSMTLLPYYLEANLLQTPSQISFTDNDIYEIAIVLQEMCNTRDEDNGIPKVVSNRSYTSFVIFNIPDNETLNTTFRDTDLDGLSDWTELYHSFTNPFIRDTDNDGATDYEEIVGGMYGDINTDPNDYTKTNYYRNRNPIVSAFGPYTGKYEEPLQLNGTAIDGEKPYTWLWNFSDGNISTEQNSTHSFKKWENVIITLTVTDKKGRTGQDQTTVTIQSVPPKKPEKPNGLTSGKINEPYTFTTVTTDPRGYPLSYTFDWGDNKTSEWTPYTPSGATINLTHTWTEKGEYQIRVKAKNTDNGESNWSDPLGIIMPKTTLKQKSNLTLINEFFQNQFPKLADFIEVIIEILN